MTFPAHRKGRIRFLAAVLILLTAAVSLYAKGAKDTTALSRADELISNKEYDKAIGLLTEYMKDDPDRFSEAQERLQNIMRFRDEYNKVANELLDVLETDPENNARILELSNLLATLESPSNPNTQRFLSQVRLLAELNVNRSRLERILVTARGQLEQNAFGEALDTYVSGLDIYRNLYFASGYGAEAEDVAARGLEAISNNVRDFTALEDPFSGAAQAMTALNGQNLPNPEEVSAVYSNLLPFMDEIIRLKAGFAGVRESFDAQLAILQARDEMLGDRSFLSFAGWLLTGPPGEDEGMSGTMDRFWRFWVNRADEAVARLVDRSYRGAYLALENRDFAGALPLFNDAGEYIATALLLVKSWDTFLAPERGETFAFYNETVNGEKAGAYLKYRAMVTALAHLREAADIGSLGAGLENEEALSSWLSGGADAPEAVSRERATRSSLQNLVARLDALDGRIAADAETLLSYEARLADAAATDGAVSGGAATAGADADTALTDGAAAGGTAVSSGTAYAVLSGARDAAAGLDNYFRALDYNSAVRQYTIANGDLEQRVSARETEFNEGNTLIGGIQREAEDASPYTAFYLTEGVDTLTRMNQSLDADIETARALIAGYNAESQSTLGAAEMNTLYLSAQALQSRLLDFRSRSAQTVTAARTRIQRAASLRFEGDRLYAAAQTALNRNDFAAARNSLARAAEQYRASLEIEDSASLRDVWETQLVGLGADIVRIENEVVVRDVRDLVTTARTGYYNGNMEQAEELLVRAQNRWRATNITEHPDVTYWMRLVRGALSLQSGRTIAVTAPLYAEMSQLLSDAKRDYDEGVRFLSGGRRREGLARFAEASSKTGEVRLIFPMNREARMIELRIDRETDTAAFNASFRQRLNQAVAGTKTGDPESFADLQDLVELNPRYQGIGALLSQAEIDMGLRPPPPNPADLARSAALTRDARAVVDARDTIRYEVAQSWLDDAVNLDPTNTQAQTLADQLNILMYGTGTIILPPFAMEQYNNALQEYLQGNYLTANAIVEQLLGNTEYRKSIQIQDLKRRIDAVL